MFGDGGMGVDENLSRAPMGSFSIFSEVPAMWRSRVSSMNFNLRRGSVMRRSSAKLSWN